MIIPRHSQIGRIRKLEARAARFGALAYAVGGATGLTIGLLGGLSMSNVLLGMSALVLFGVIMAALFWIHRSAQDIGRQIEYAVGQTAQE